MVPSGDRYLVSRLCLGVLALLAASCGEIFFECPESAQPAVEVLPQKLSETGLYADIAGQEIAAEVRSYRPRFELWSDGAEKSRWLSLPAGTTIDTSDMDNWVFPPGTRVWKEFADDLGPIETRYFEKFSDGSWLGQSYRWNERKSEAVAQPYGYVNAGAQGHDLPSALECVACHGGRQSFLLGVSAIQLAYDSEEDLDLASLGQAGLLSEPASQPVSVPGDDTAVEALGYLHANCAHCHNADAVRAPCFYPDNELDFWIPVGLSDVQALPTLRTAIGFAIEPGRPGASLLIERMQTRDFIYRMPPIGSEKVDDDALRKVRAWIAEL